MTREEYIKKKGGDNVTFKIVDASTVKRRQREGDIKLPKKKVAVDKDERWNTKLMNSKLLQGILAGEPIPKIAGRMLSIVGNNEASAVRNARTMITQAENNGRLDSYQELADQGVVQAKVWIATPDDRTRESHLDIDGEEIDIDEEFSNGLMFPGDPDGEPSEVWNCRCSMRTHIIGFRRDDGSVSEVNYERDATTHDAQIEAEKDKREVEGGATKEKKTDKFEEEYNHIMRDIDDYEVKYNEVKELNKSISEQEIIDKISGGDKTKGSCASLSFTYCANKIGLDVTDFRGGGSQEVFCDVQNIHRLFKIAGAKTQEYTVKKEAAEVAKIISGIELDKEFVISTGKHCAIIRRTKKDGLQYLELQSPKVDGNGWKPFEFESDIDYRLSRTTTETLVRRFGCRKTADKMKGSSRVFEKKLVLAEVDSFKKTDDFKNLLGYINTDKKKQKKGSGGSVK